MLASGIPTKIPVPWASNALSPYIRAIPPTSQIAIQNGAASWPDGFPAWCFQPNGFPFGQDFNGVLNLATSWLQWYNAGGPIVYDGTYSAAVGGYMKGAIVQSATTFGQFWYCTADNNTTNPDSGGAGWTGFTLAIPTSIIYYGVDSGAADAIVVNVIPNILSLQSGMMFEITAVAANTKPNPTATITNVANPSPITIQRWDGSGLQPGDILPAPYKGLYAYDGTANRLYLLNPGNLLQSPPVLTSPRNLYVNGSTGSDLNDGLSTQTALANIQPALHIATSYNQRSYNVTINVIANGTYQPITLPQINGSGTISINGNSQTQCIISGSTVSAINATSFTGTYYISGFSLQSSGNPSIANDLCAGIYAAHGGVVYLSNIDFGACTGGHMVSSVGSTIGLSLGSLSISGGCAGNSSVAVPCHMISNAGGVINVGANSQLPSLTVSNTVTMNTFAAATQGGTTSVAYSSITNPSNVTASKYLATLNGTVNSGGRGVNYYPGNTAGSTNTGGQFA